MTEEMIIVTCPTCSMSLYMRSRSLHERTWTCPACGNKQTEISVEKPAAAIASGR